MAIAFGEEAATSRDGRELLDLSVRLVARLYPSLTFATIPAGESFADELMTLARNINPNIEASTTGTPDVALAVGMDAPPVDAPTVFYAGCDGWVGHVGTKGPYQTSDLGNPYGAGFAACLAVANLFRFLFIPGGTGLFDDDITFPPDAASFPSLTASTLTDPLVLVGAGAVGNSAAWALARTPLVGEIYLVDPETIELSNLQRYALCARSDEGGVKVEVSAEVFEGALHPLPHRGTWASFLEANGYNWERVLVALDSARDRRAVQASLPRWIVNAWTQDGDLGVSSHAFLGLDACLACLYLPTHEVASEDQVIAEGLRIPGLQAQVRDLLATGQGVDRGICDAIATACEIPAAKLEPYVGGVDTRSLDRGCLWRRHHSPGGRRNDSEGAACSACVPIGSRRRPAGRRGCPRRTDRGSSAQDFGATGVPPASPRRNVAPVDTQGWDWQVYLRGSRLRFRLPSKICSRIRTGLGVWSWLGREEACRGRVAQSTNRLPVQLAPRIVGQ